MTDVSGQIGDRTAATAVVHESYSFACMRCGHGWEQSYEIEHHPDAEGRERVRYVVDGEVVPSPLSRPMCRRCDGHVVRIMRPGQVSSAQNGLPRQERRVPADESPADESTADKPPAAPARHLTGLLHLFQRRTC
ncbi:hypothetical protein [Streptomyces poonensis]|uniref:C2H2-type domain-containing protein n=1 Tax=Streptomyces poonensis TaxID=68255 RepID=A0A918P9S4_9ACTN|nr:hypothetical protein [Streptomyces poonensis]GGY93465.1 hypothetical protein GCM10010365_10130 [Streptomyces poonensis]GLJ87547.1 hypothetical protein GCM10017589_01470 [Streptomyces poonensis]